MTVIGGVIRSGGAVGGILTSRWVPPPVIPSPVQFFVNADEVAATIAALSNPPFAGAWANEKAFADARLNYTASPPDPDVDYSVNWHAQLYTPGWNDGHAAHSLAFAYLMTGNFVYAEQSLSILRDWRDTYTHPAAQVGHFVAEPMGFAIKMFMALDMLRNYISAAEFAGFVTWATQWISVGQTNCDITMDFPWDEAVINGHLYSNAWGGNNATNQRAMAVWAAAVSGGAVLETILDWNWSHVTPQSNVFSWDRCLDDSIINTVHSGGTHTGAAVPGEIFEGHQRESLFYGLFGWYSLLLIADVALHAEWTPNLYTYTTPRGVNLADVAEFYSPFIQNATASAIQAFYNQFGGDGAVNSDPGQWRGAFEYLYKNLPGSHLRYADVEAAVEWGGNSVREDNYHIHIARHTPVILGKIEAAPPPPPSGSIMLQASRGQQDPGEVAYWSVYDSPTSQIWPGPNRDKHRIIRWASDGLYSDRLMYSLHGFRIVQGTPGRMFDWHTQPNDVGGWTPPGNAAGVAPLALDYPSTVGSEQGFIIAAQAEQDVGQPWQFVIAQPAEVATWLGQWKWVWVECRWGRRELATKGSLRVWIAGEETPRVNKTNINTHWSGEQMVTFWEGAYVSTSVSVLTILEAAATRFGRTPEECYNDDPVVFSRESSGNENGPGGTVVGIAEIEGGNIPIPAALAW